MKFLREWGLFILLFAAIILTRIYLWAPINVSGHSMDPTLADKEKIIMLKQTKIKRFDVVIAKETEADNSSKHIVKRVIGLPGDTVTFKQDTLTINGKVYDEPYLDNFKKKFADDKLQSEYSYDTFFQETAANISAFTVNDENQADFSVKVADDEYFLLGDDRPISKDSRQLGNFNKSEIEGKATYIIMPFKKMGTIK